MAPIESTTSSPSASVEETGRPLHSKVVCDFHSRTGHSPLMEILRKVIIGSGPAGHTAAIYREYPPEEK